jgi:hypothetical protein
MSDEVSRLFLTLLMKSLAVVRRVERRVDEKRDNEAECAPHTEAEPKTPTLLWLLLLPLLPTPPKVRPISDS